MWSGPSPSTKGRLDMWRIFGPRTVVEAAFLIAVPVVAVFVAGLGKYPTIAASAVGYLLVLVVEATLWREGPPVLRLRSARAARTERRAPAPAPAREVVTAPAAAAEPEPAPVAPEPAAVEPEPVAVEPEPPAAEPQPAPAPEPVAEPHRAPEHVRVLRPERDPVEPVPVERPPLVAVAEPELEPEPEPEVVPVAPVVVPIGVGAGPRQWNLWDLERLTRDRAGVDTVRDEERTFLLMYLREFADPDGLLPVDFDGLVRDSFGELVGAR